MPGLELAELRCRAAGWTTERRLIVVRQSIQGWRYGASVTTLDLPMVEVWRTYRGRAECENRIKELKADFGLDAFNMRDFWATEAALGFAMLAYDLMSLFRQAVLRCRVQHTLSTLHGRILAVGGSWHPDPSQNKLMLCLPRRKRAWFAGPWANASAPPVFPGLHGG